MDKIITKKGQQKELEKIFGCCHVTVRRALNGVLATELGNKIRKAAIEKGGKTYIEKN